MSTARNSTTAMVATSTAKAAEPRLVMSMGATLVKEVDSDQLLAESLHPLTGSITDLDSTSMGSAAFIVSVKVLAQPPSSNWPKATAWVGPRSIASVRSAITDWPRAEEASAPPSIAPLPPVASTAICAAVCWEVWRTPSGPVM